jgi:hypothetical protein
MDDMTNYEREYSRVVVDGIPLSQLDDAVARALGWIDYPDDSIEHGRYWHIMPDKAPFGRRLEKSYWHPSTSWRQAGLLIEKDRIHIEHKDGCVGAYYHRYHPFGYCNGKTVLEAVCRIFVLERMRKTVTHPIEIVI